MKRRCAVCGRNISIVLQGKKYSSGHYFGKIKLPVGKGEHKKVGVYGYGKHKFDVVKWTGKHKEFEYWECNKCFEDALHESWLEEKIEKLFGKKCKEYEPHCPTCEAWSLYETILEDNRGKL